LADNDPKCTRCEHRQSQHEINSEAGDTGHPDREMRGACEVRTCFCPGFSSPS